MNRSSGDKLRAGPRSGTIDRAATEAEYLDLLHVPFHLRPSAPTAADAIVCGDPARALVIAQHVMTQPRISNHNRGLWGYFGETPAGRPLTVQATGIGGPSAVAVVGEAIELGVKSLVRVGTCAAPEGDGPPGALRVLGAALSEDGASRSLGAEPGEAVPADPELTAELAALAGNEPVTISSRDVMAEPDDGGGLVDLQTSALLQLCRIRGTTAGATAIIRSVGGRPLHDDPLEAALLRAADLAVTALGKLSTST